MGNLVLDYFIKDHLGNTRMTLTESPETIEYRATMEVGTSQGTDMQAFEESVFLNLAAVRDSSQPLGNTTDVPDITDDKSARLNGSDANRRIGPAKMMVVSAGDQINVTVDSYHAGSYTNSGYQTQAMVTAALAAVLGTGTSSATEATGISNLVNGLPSSTAVFVGASGTQSRPKAYLNVLIFDQDFNYKDGAAVQTDQASGYKTLSVNKTVAEGGYVYVYLSNESQTDFNVFFDDLEIGHVKGNILQEDHYYPFGLSINALSSTAPLSKPNKFKFNGIEEATDFDINVYTAQLRTYDPQLGRWWQIDPKASERESPYVGMGNNPILYNDYLGDTVYTSTKLRVDGDITYINKTTHIEGKVLNAATSTAKNVRQFTSELNKKLNSQSSSTTVTRPDGKKIITTTSIQANYTVAESMDDVSSSDHLLALVDNVEGTGDPKISSGQGAVGLADLNGQVAYVEGASRDIVNTAFHEVGHNLGLRHPDKNDSTNPMSYTGRGASFSATQLDKIFNGASQGLPNSGSNSVTMGSAFPRVAAGTTGRSSNSRPFTVAPKKTSRIPKPLINRMR